MLTAMRPRMDEPSKVQIRRREVKTPEAAHRTLREPCRNYTGKFLARLERLR